MRNLCVTTPPRRGEWRAPLCGDIVMPEQTRPLVARWIAEILQAHPDLTLEKWAKAAGIDKSSMSRLARQDMGIRYDTLWRLANAVHSLPPLPDFEPLTVELPIVTRDDILQILTASDMSLLKSNEVVMVPPTYSGCLAFQALVDYPHAFIASGDTIVFDISVPHGESLKEERDRADRKYLVDHKEQIGVYQRTGRYLVPLGPGEPVAINDAVSFWPIVAVIRRL